VQRASILDLKLMQAFTRVSLARNPITSFIFWIRSLDLLRNFALTHNSETPHTKHVKRVAVRQAGKPDLLLHPHLRKVLFEPGLHPLAVLNRAAVLLGDF
jgi:hypothetical protein